MKYLTAGAALALLSNAAGAEGMLLYGMADMFVGQVRQAGGAAMVADSGGMGTSFWGMAGEEKLSESLSAIFALEAHLQVDTGETGRYGDRPNPQGTSDRGFTRSAYVGLSSDTWGEVRLGRISTLLNNRQTIRFNPFFNSTTLSPMMTQTYVPTGEGGTPTFTDRNVQGDTGWNNAINYNSPEWKGLRAAVMIGMGSELTQDPDRNYNKAWSGGVYYDQDRLAAGFTFQDINRSLQGSGRSQRTWQVGMSYRFDWATVFGQYQQSRDTFTLRINDQSATTFQLGASVPAGPGKVLVSYAATLIDYANGATPDRRRAGFAAAYVYSLSRRTDLYAAYFKDVVRASGADLSNDQTMGLGMRHKF